MEFSIQPAQIIWALLLLVVIWGVLKLKQPKQRLLAVGAVVILVLFNPVRFKQEGMSKTERFSSTEIELPEKVIVEDKSFKEKQAEEMAELKNDSKESVKNELD